MRPGVEPEDQQRHLHHLLMVEGVSIQALLAEALAMIRGDHHRRRACARREAGQQVGPLLSQLIASPPR